MNQSPNNAYFEQQKHAYFQQLTVQDLENKMAECASIVNDIDGSKLYEIISKDCKEKEQFIDDNWYLITDEVVLNNMRVKKNAIRYILDLKKQYQEELDYSQTELKVRISKDTNIIKDYDG
ncbi:MAG: hypothetical protein GY861_15665 [bacterium]|nr:hypothetical protein [bacterium]